MLAALLVPCALRQLVDAANQPLAVNSCSVARMNDTIASLDEAPAAADSSAQEYLNQSVPESAPLSYAHSDENARWFASEVHSHDLQLKSYLRGSFPYVRDVDDVVQESYLRVWRRHLAQPIVSAKAFLFQVARNLAMDVIRHNRASPITEALDSVTLPVGEEHPGVVEGVCVNEEVDLLCDAITALPPRCREIVVLRKIKGVSQKEIASKLGLSESTVQVQASRGLRRCAEFLRERGVTRTCSQDFAPKGHGASGPTFAGVS